MDTYRDHSYPPLDPFPTSDQMKAASEFQLNEFASRGTEQDHMVVDERTRREIQGDFGYTTDDTSLLCLKEILLEDSEDETVTMKKFGKALAWFGPVVGNTTEPKIILLTSLYDTLSKE